MSESKSHNCKMMANALTEQGIAVNRTTVFGDWITACCLTMEMHIEGFNDENKHKYKDKVECVSMFANGWV